MNIRKRELERLTFAIRAALAELIAEAECWPTEPCFRQTIRDLYYAAKDAGLEVDDYAPDVRRVAGRKR